MRGILLLLLGAGLFWLVISNFGTSVAGNGDQDDPGSSTDPAASVTGPADDGRMLPRPEGRATEAAVSEPDGAPTDGAPAAAPSVWEPPAGAVDDGGSGLEAWMDAGQEEELAARVLHDPRSLPRFFEEDGRDLSLARKELALGYVNAIHGRAEEARHYASRVAEAPEVTAQERDLLAAAIERRSAGPLPASTRRANPLMLAVRIALRAEEAREHADEARFEEAAAAFSDVLLEELDAPWAADRELLREWSAELMRVQERYRWNRRGGWRSVDVEVRPGDSLTVIRKRFLQEHGRPKICTGLIDRANELNGRYLRPGEVLRIPTDRAHVLVDLDARWLVYLLGDEVVGAWEVGIGKSGQETRPGPYVAGKKVEEPTWFRPGQEPVPFGDPENALGTRWIGWNLPDGGSSESLGIHGTNDPAGVGGKVSRGCVRMHNADVEALFEVLPVGSEILVRG